MKTNGLSLEDLRGQIYFILDTLTLYITAATPPFKNFSSCVFMLSQPFLLFHWCFELLNVCNAKGLIAGHSISSILFIS